MRRVLALANLVFSTIFLSLLVIFISPFDRSGKITSRLERFWARLHLFVCGIKVNIDGVENIISGPCVFMCNHRSVLDIFGLYYSLKEPFVWIAKEELFSVPFLGWALKAGGHIGMDRKNPKKAIKSLNRALNNLKDGKKIIIFPEGTWGKGDKLLPFKRGGFDIAIKGGVPVIPIGIKGTGDLQPEGYNVPVKKGIIHIIIAKPIYNPKGLLTERKKLMDSVKKELEDLIFYNK